MMKVMLTIFTILVTTLSYGQTTLNNTDKTAVSLFWNESGKQVLFAESASGNLFQELGHHGPAVENLWVAYRLYFDKRHCIDIYSKFEPRLELDESGWYTMGTPLDDKNYGMDNYMVGQTVGLGGLKLWDNGELKFIDPVTTRRAEIVREDNDISKLIMISKGVPYENKQVDIEYALTVFPDERHAMVEVRSLTGVPVQFVTGISVIPQPYTEVKKNYIVTWGDHKSPLSSRAFDVGAAIVFDHKDFEKTIESRNEISLVSKPAIYLRYFITSSNEDEESDLNTLRAFKRHVQNLQKNL